MMIFEKKLADDKKTCKISEHAKSLYRDQMSMQGMLVLNFYGFVWNLILQNRI